VSVSKQQYHFLIDHPTDCAVILLDARGYVLAWNAMAERLLGYREDEIVGEHFGRLFFRSEEVRRGEPEYELDTARTRGPAASERWYARKDGTVLWGASVTAALRDRSGQVWAFAKLMRDRTDQKRLKCQPEEPQKVEAENSPDDLDNLLKLIESCNELLVGKPPSGDARPYRPDQEAGNKPGAPATGSRS
jgi:PAS domain S-box-containing protein